MRFNYIRALATAVLALFLVGCSHDVEMKQRAIENVATPYAEGAITVNLTAEPLLNAWQEMPNSITVMIIQAASRSQLDSVLKNRSEIRALFHGAASHSHLIKTDRYTLMPNQQHTLHIDRAENTRQIAIIAGYYPFPTERQMARFAVPVNVESLSWWQSEWQATLAPLVLSITFGKNSIVSIRGADNLIKTTPAIQGMN